MSRKQTLFRHEAVEAKRGGVLGAVNVATPLSRWALTLLGAGFAVAVVLFLLFGHYTKRQHVVGQLVPSTGLLTVTATSTGTVTGVFIHAGQHVHQGERLLEVATRRDSATLGGTFAAITAQLHSERRRLRQNLATEARQSRAQADALHAKLSLLAGEQQQLSAQLKLQAQQAAGDQRLLQRMQPLLAKGYVSAVQVQQEQTAVVGAREQLKALQRQRLQIRQKITTAQQQLTQLPLQLSTQKNTTSNQIARIDQQLAQNEAQHATVLRAPRAGVVSTLLAKSGQHVAAGQSLLSIVPQGASLQARLLVPSRAIGSIKPGSAVVLHYQAYPYQEFGQQYGHIASISRSALSPKEVVMLTGHPAKQPLYRVRVKLDHQTIMAYGKPHALKPGMSLTADILMNRRSLLQWAFKPLYGLKGSATAGEGAAHG